MRRSILPTSSEWPPELNELGPEKPPTELHVDGAELPRKRDCIAIVGTRDASVAGAETARAFARRFAEAGYTVVSGMARGIDSAAHRGALEVGGNTVAVVGCGLDLTYPPRNENLKRQIAAHGSVVSEYPDGTEPHKHHFPQRNRIIAGLSEGVVVIEGGLKSGALITARIAVEANRNVWAVPGSPQDPRAAGPNELIRAGQAGLVTHPDQVFEEIAPEIAWRGPYEVRRPSTVSLTEEEVRALSALSLVPSTADQVCTAVKMAPGRLALCLSKLEIRGLARRSRGGGYLLSEGGARALEGALDL